MDEIQALRVERQGREWWIQAHLLVGPHGLLLFLMHEVDDVLFLLLMCDTSVFVECFWQGGAM